ncbi:MAG: hypothetical protein QXS01_07080, partial [Candidatus Bathyarchaeia archaeon]
VTYPIFSARWAAGNRDTILVSLKRWTLRAGVPLGVALILFAPLLSLLIPLLFGTAFRPAILPAQIMILGQGISAPFFWLNSFYYASGRIGTWVKGYTLYTAAIILASGPVAAYWSFVGLASLVTATEVTFTVGMLSLVLIWRRKWTLMSVISKH